MAINTDTPTWNTTKNDITGAPLVSKPNNKLYEDGWDRIFGNKEKNKEEADGNSDGQ